MPLESSAESPVPVRTVLRLVGEWIGRLGRVWVEGQIAELTRRGAVVFLTLRDPVAAVSVRVMCPRTVLDANDPAPAEGARVVVWAKPDFNINRGAFALTAIEIRAVGIGELLARLERLRQALAAEGLFAAARKRPLPFLPATVGLICGRQAAARSDVVETARRRFAPVVFRIRECAVQGAAAPGELAGALAELDRDAEVDVIVLARGGGSLEDLWAFNDEVVVRAVVAHAVPVVCGVGHEADVTLADFAADVRAPTPSAAAEIVVPDRAEFLVAVRDAGRRLDGAATARLRTTAREVVADQNFARLEPRKLASKRGLRELCLAHSIPTPEAAFPASLEDVEAFATVATFPARTGVDVRSSWRTAMLISSASRAT
jgi:exodeoxyribonuclease VII large subunit